MKICRARRNGTQELRPVLKPKKATPHHVNTAAVIYSRRRVLLAQRPAKGLLAAMWEFPNRQVDGNPAKGLVKALKTGYGLKVKRGEPLDAVNHAYSHFSITVYPFICELVSMSKKNGLHWVKLIELDRYPMGKIDRKIARQIQRAMSEK